MYPRTGMYHRSVYRPAHLDEALQARDRFKDPLSTRERGRETHGKKQEERAVRSFGNTCSQFVVSQRQVRKQLICRAGPRSRSQNVTSTTADPLRSIIPSWWMRALPSYTPWLALLVDSPPSAPSSHTNRLCHTIYLD